jgi:flagellar hook-basal body complex protein FliE
MMLTGVTSPPLVANLDPARPAAGVAPAASASLGAQGEVRPGDFAAVLGQMAKDAIGVIKASEATAVAGVRGQATVQQVVEAVMAAEQTLQAGISIRDKVVSAYLEISRMSI